MVPGLANGKAFVYRDVLQRDSESYLIAPDEVVDEEARVNTAIEHVSQGLLIDAKQIEEKFGQGAADIFVAQESMLRDPMVKDRLRKALHQELINAEQVVRIVFRRLASTFRDFADEIFRARGDDVDDLSRRLLLSLGGIHAHSLETLPSHTILVARRLLPSDTVFLSRASTIGVVAEFAGPAAHAALLAREMGIPCVGGIHDLLGRVHSGDDIFVDGSAGTVVINPDDEYSQQFNGIREARESREKDLTQYTMAAGRENSLVSQYFIENHPAVFRLIDLVVSEAGTTSVSICGELAGRIDTLPRLLASGINILSVPAASVPSIKAARRMTLKVGRCSAVPTKSPATGGTASG